MASTTLSPPLPGAPGSTARRPLAARLLRGHAGDPRWARPALLALPLATTVSYLAGLSANGYANQFYAAAVQGGSTSWKAAFSGSLDAGNAITVDKTPASLWVMELSVRLSGLNSWALLAPQALIGVATVALVVGSVRRTLGRPGPRWSPGSSWRSPRSRSWCSAPTTPTRCWSSCSPPPTPSCGRRTAPARCRGSCWPGR